MILVKVFIYLFKKIFHHICIHKITKTRVEPYNFPFSIFTTIYLIITIRIFFIHIQFFIIINIIRHFRLKISKLFFEPHNPEGFNIHFTTSIEKFLIWW